MDKHADRVNTAAPAAAKLEVDDLDNCATPCATTVAMQLCDALASVYIGQIIFFENKAALINSQVGNFEFGADVNAVAIRSGVSRSAGTSGAMATASSARNAASGGKYYKGMAVFTVVKGGGDGPSHGGWRKVLIQTCRGQLTVYIPGQTDFRPLRLQPKLAINTVNQLLVICLAYVNVRA
jgi:hypothetical protein